VDHPTVGRTADDDVADRRVGDPARRHRVTSRTFHARCQGRTRRRAAQDRVGRVAPTVSTSGGWSLQLWPNSGKKRPDRAGRLSKNRSGRAAAGRESAGNQLARARLRLTSSMDGLVSAAPLAKVTVGTVWLPPFTDITNRVASSSNSMLTSR